MKQLEEREKDMGTELLLRVFRHFYLEEIDRAWVEHLTNMEHLRDGIGLRGYGQQDPKQEYKKEGYDIFVNMMASTSSNVCTKLFSVQVKKENEIERIEREDLEKPQPRGSRRCRCATASEVDGGDEAGRRRHPERGVHRRRRPARSRSRSTRDAPKIGRNDLCPCGSGEKFKKCHGAALEEDSGDASP